MILITSLTGCKLAERQGRQEDDTSYYYLKGASSKTFSNKIGIIAAGQSNIDGRCPYSLMPESIKVAQPMMNVYYVKNSTSESFSPMNITNEWAFDLVTYYYLAATLDEFYVIKWSKGGTSIDPLGESDEHWTADYENSTPHKSLLINLEASVRNHIHLSDSDEVIDIRAMLWHQGEGDRGDIGTKSDERYYLNLRNMIAYIRGVVGNAQLPIISGTISHCSKQYDETIEAAQRRLAKEDPYFYLIDMSGASLQDNFHFDATSSIYFGEMCYDKLIEAGVINAEKLNPLRPW